jgi:dTDP-4-amino-4,6-dideoxygalactose transaminase
MSEDSSELLKRLNVMRIFQKRRKNFKLLLKKRFENIEPFHKNLPDGVCPLGFPVLSKKRDELKRHLIKNRIYPPIHWKLPDSISKSDFPQSWKISDSIITIPIDQRYNQKHINHIINILDKFK